MKKSKKAILDALKDVRKGSKLEALVLNMVLQKLDSDSFDFDGDAVYTTDGKRMVYCVANKQQFIVPEGVEVIGEMAFRSKKKLKKVMLPTTLKRIEKDAFYDCDDLDNVVLPYSVTSVKGYAFAECDSLRNITFTSLPAQLAKHAFSDSDNLQKIYVPKGTYKKFIKFLNLNGDENFLIQETEETGENQTRQDMPSISAAEKVEENNETTDGGNETEE